MNIILADDHKLFRDVFVSYIKRIEPHAHIDLADNFSDVLTFIDQDEERDLIILDYQMPGMFGLNGVATLRSLYPDLFVVLMSGAVAPDIVTQAIEKGIRGYFPKTLSGTTIANAIDLVLSGETFFPHDYDTQDVMPSYYADPVTNDDTGVSQISKPANAASCHVAFSEREMKVLNFLATGEPNKIIANEMNSHLSSVKADIRSICNKLHVSNRTQAALKLRDMGIV